MSTVAFVVQRFLWFVPAILQAGAAILMLRRKMHAELPMFFSYLVFKVALTAILFPLRRYAPHYFYAYWIGEAISLILGLAVIYEVFSGILKRYDAINRLGLLLYRGTAVLLLVVAAITAATGPGLSTPHMIEGILTLERGVRIMQVGLLFFVFIFASYLGLSWRNHLFGIALGLGFFASIELVLLAIRAHTGVATNQMLVWGKPAAYNVMTYIWTFYLLRPQPQPEAAKSLPKTEAAGWNQALAEYLRR
jgi:hypothetical protein